MSKDLFHIIRARDLQIEAEKQERDNFIKLLEYRDFNNNQKYKNQKQ